MQSIALDRPVPDIHAKVAVTYHVALTGPLTAARAVTQDARQVVSDLTAGGKAFDLTITARRAPGAVATPVGDPGPEYLAASHFIDWQTDATRRHAAAAVAGLPAGASAWRKAQAVEAYVHRTMKPAVFRPGHGTPARRSPPASAATAPNLRCSPRACAGPSGCPPGRPLAWCTLRAKTGEPTLAYHMWFEVFAGGEWLMLDATLGRGSVGPGHIKITSVSWDNEPSMAPLLPVMAVLGARPDGDRAEK